MTTEIKDKLISRRKWDKLIYDLLDHEMIPIDASGYTNLESVFQVNYLEFIKKSLDMFIHLVGFVEPSYDKELIAQKMINCVLRELNQFPQFRALKLVDKTQFVQYFTMVLRESFKKVEMDTDLFIKNKMLLCATGVGTLNPDFLGNANKNLEQFANNIGLKDFVINYQYVEELQHWMEKVLDKNPSGIKNSKLLQNAKKLQIISRASTSEYNMYFKLGISALISTVSMAILSASFFQYETALIFNLMITPLTLIIPGLISFKGIFKAYKKFYQFSCQANLEMENACISFKIQRPRNNNERIAIIPIIPTMDVDYCSVAPKAERELNANDYKHILHSLEQKKVKTTKRDFIKELENTSEQIVPEIKSEPLDYEGHGVQFTYNHVTYNAFLPNTSLPKGAEAQAIIKAFKKGSDGYHAIDFDGDDFKIRTGFNGRMKARHIPNPEGQNKILVFDMYDANPHDSKRRINSNSLR